MYDEKFIEYVRFLFQQGVLVLDENGQIWRHKKGCHAGTYNPCKVVRAENKSPKGYLRLTIQYDGKLKCIAAHRVVWILNNGEIPPGLEINHKDGVKANNSISNLELVTSSENSLHAVRTKLRRPPWSVTQKEGRVWWVPGRDKSGAPLITNGELDQMVNEVLRGRRITEVAKQYNVSKSYLGQVFKRKMGKTARAFRDENGFSKKSKVQR